MNVRIVLKVYNARGAGEGQIDINLYHVINQSSLTASIFRSIIYRNFGFLSLKGEIKRVDDNDVSRRNLPLDGC